MFQPVEIPAMHFVRSIRVHLGRCSESSFKQVGLRRLRDAARLADKDYEQAMTLIREAGLMLQYAQSHDEREAARRA